MKRTKALKRYTNSPLQPDYSNTYKPTYNPTYYFLKYTENWPKRDRSNGRILRSETGTQYVFNAESSRLWTLHNDYLI